MGLVLVMGVVSGKRKLGSVAVIHGNPVLTKYILRDGLIWYHSKVLISTAIRRKKGSILQDPGGTRYVDEGPFGHCDISS